LNVSVASLFIRERLTLIDVTVAKQAITIAGQRSVSPSRTGDTICKASRRAFSEDTPISLSDVARRLGFTTTEQLYQLTGDSATELPPGIDTPEKAIGGENLEQQGSAMFLGCKRFSRNLWNLMNRSRFTASPLVSAIQTTVTYSKSISICVQPSAKRSRRGNRPNLRNCTGHWKMFLTKIHHPLWLNLVAA
jgi:hypothetical protein